VKPELLLLGDFAAWREKKQSIHGCLRVGLVARRNGIGDCLGAMKVYETGILDKMGLDLREEDVIMGLVLVFEGQDQVLTHMSLVTPDNLS
jgi:hypothetical protein